MSGWIGYRCVLCEEDVSDRGLSFKIRLNKNQQWATMAAIHAEKSHPDLFRKVNASQVFGWPYTVSYEKVFCPVCRAEFDAPGIVKHLARHTPQQFDKVAVLWEMGRQ